MASSLSPYQPPVAAFLTLGEPVARQRSPGCADFGITADEIPELIRMAVDPALNSAPGDSLAVWAPVHAWRALGELRAVEAVEPLLGLLHEIDDHDDDWASNELPPVFAALGAPSIAPVAAYLADSSHGQYARAAAARALALIGQTHADTRTDCIAHLARQAANFVAETPALNGFLVSALLDLRAVEAAPVLERAFASGNVDVTIAGDWEEVQVELGMKVRREHPPRPDRFTEMGRQLREAFGMPEPDVDRFETDATIEPLEPTSVVRAAPRVGRNDPCPCGSGKKFKKCCGT